MAGENDNLDGTSNTENANNITVATAIQAKHIAILPKFEHPQKFNPACEDAVKFLKTFEARTNANQWTDSHKLAYFGSYLEGYAYDWYVRYLLDEGNASKTWQQVKSDFIAEYTPDNPTRDMRRALAQRKQRNTEDIRQYFYSILELCGELDPNMDIELIKDYFENGLREVYKDQFLILATPAMTLRDLKTVVHKLHKIHTRAIQNEINHSPPTLLTMETGRNQQGNNSNTVTQRNTANNRTTTAQTGPRATNAYNNNREWNRTRSYNRQDENNNFRRFPTFGNFTNQNLVWNANQSQGNTNYRPIQHGPPRPYQNNASTGNNTAGRNQSTYATPSRQGRNSFLPNTRSRTGQVICWNCNKSGHHLRNCNEPIRSNQKQQYIDYSRNTDNRGNGDSNPNYPGRR